MSNITGDAAGNILIGTNDIDTIFGMDGDDSLSGLNGDDSLDGGSGDDTLAGGLGNDTYVVDTPADQVMEAANAGLDTVISSVSYSLGMNLENLTLAAMAGNLNGTGNMAANSIAGNEWNNRLAGLAGNDTISAGAGMDTVDGGMGADFMTGGQDDDTYVVDNAGDVVTENMDEGIDSVQSTVSFTLGANLENLSLGGTAGLSGTGNATFNRITGNGGANLLIGLAGDDTLAGLAGNDTLDGGMGMDSMAGGTGDDTYVVDDVGDAVMENGNEGKDTVRSTVTYMLGANLENLVLTGMGDLNGTGNELANAITGNSGKNLLSGGAGNDTVAGQVDDDGLSGGDGNDRLDGGDGNDILVGGAGKDTLIGGTGNDTYNGVDAGEQVLEAAGADIDTVIVGSLASYTLGANLENLTLSGATVPLNTTFTGIGNQLNNFILAGGFGAARLSGMAGNDTLSAREFSDTLDGGAGADLMQGDAGDDTYVVDNVMDQAVEDDINNGTDTIISSVSFALGLGLDNLTLTGAAALNGTGNDLANAIIGNAGSNKLTGMGGNDTLNGGAGADTLAGGAGDDSYVVDNAKDMVSEAAMAGLDTVTSSVTFTLGMNLENLVLTGTMGLAGTGNMSDNAITGNAGANKLSGLDGDDTIVGGAGNDTIDGGVGFDSAAGGTGNDLYIVDDPFGDIIGENLGEGVDTVQSFATSYTLLANIENLKLLGMAIGGSGNELDNVITGNALDNALDGSFGNDTIVAGDGVDSIFAGDGADSIDGGSGNDFINGETGADKMAGGAGDDTYVVETVGDTVVEAMNGGKDEVISLINHTLAANVEILTLIGSGLTGTGNAMDNTLISTGDNLLQGLAGNDMLIGQGLRETLDGGTGTDTMAGGFGDDLYIVDNAKDTVTENMGEGFDTVRSSVGYALAANVENLILSGTSAIAGTGNAMDNLIAGNTGNNTLVGLGGNDTITGGGGRDRFDFNMLDGSVDVITDFTSGATGDIIDVMDLLTGFMPGISVLDNFVRFVSDGMGNTQVQVNADGMGMDFVTVALLQGVMNLTAAQALAAGNLVVSVMAMGGMMQTPGQSFTGTAGADKLMGTAGADTIDGLGGNDTMTGGAGNDVYVVSDSGDDVVEAANGGTDVVQLNTAAHMMAANVENLVVTATSGIFTVTGNNLANIIDGSQVNSKSIVDISGGGGDDLIFGGQGIDDLDGGAGNDTVHGGAGGDNLVLGGIGNDLLFADAPGSAGFDGDDLGGGEGNDTLMGDAGNDILRGEAGNDSIFGGATSDPSGFSIDDSIFGGDGSDTIDGGAGDDIIYGEDVTFGVAGADSITGGTGRDSMIGGGGNDTMRGGVGDDLYVLDNKADSIIEMAGEGRDLVGVSFDYTLLDNFEDLSLSGGGDIAGTGNGVDNNIFGSAGKNALMGLAGNDTLEGRDGADTLTGGSGSDQFFYGTSALDGKTDMIADFTAGAGGDALDLRGIFSSVSGPMIELAMIGNFVQFVSNGNDTLVQVNADGMGMDFMTIARLQNVTGASVTQFLADGNLILPVTVTGTDNDDMLTGFSGSDRLFGLGGSDSLVGGAGADTLDGGTGADTMAGGTFSDRYLVDNVLDIIVETDMTAADLNDSVRSLVSYTLSANVENLDLGFDALKDTSPLDGTGNASDNIINGNAGANVIMGLDGNDNLFGGDAADTLMGGNGNDNINATDGNDIVTGDSGNDTLFGGNGVDTITGGAGADVFDRNSLLTGGVDVITDFQAGPGGDVLAISDLLLFNADNGDNINDFVRFVEQGGDTRVQIDFDGTGTTSPGFVDIVLFQGVTGLSVSQALADGNIDTTTTF